MASITGKNLTALVEAKNLASRRILKDPDFADKCAEKLLEIQEYEQQEKRLAQRMGEIRRAYFIENGVIAPRSKKNAKTSRK